MRSPSEGEALATLVVDELPGGMQEAAIKAPGLHVHAMSSSMIRSGLRDWITVSRICSSDCSEESFVWSHHQPRSE
jgi:hypothetical protein